MTETNSTTDVIAIGAGMAGLTSAGELAKADVSTIVLDEGRAPGGRTATRTIDGARFDHGAQHFSARSELFRERVGQLRDAGIVTESYEARSWTTPDRGIEFVWWDQAECDGSPSTSQLSSTNAIRLRSIDWR